MTSLFACSVGFNAASAVNPAQAMKAGSEAIDSADTLELTGLQKRFEAIARRVAPAVVAISASNSAVSGDEALRNEEMNTEKLTSMLEKTVRTVGTGSIVDSDGYIVTNQHVVGEAEQLWVTTDDHRVFPAIVIGSDPRADLAILKVPASNLPTVRFAPSGSVTRGQWTIALGNPYGLATVGEMAMSVGVVSAVNRSLPKLASKEERMYDDLIQTTAQINPGNSGGPLFDLNGDVIGINTAVILPQRQTNGIGFALPITPRLMELIQNLKQGQEVVYGYVGVSVSTPTTRDRRAGGLTQDAGVKVESVEAQSPATGRLRERDILVRVGGQTVYDAEQFVRVVGAMPVGQELQMDIYRNGKPMVVSVVPIKRKLPQIVVTRDTQRFRWRGMLLGPIPQNWNFVGGKRPDKGLMVLAIESNSPLAKQGICQGAIITTIAGKPVMSVADLQRVLNETPQDKCEVQLATSTTVGGTK